MSVTGPLFTQKHYEHLERALCRMRAFFEAEKVADATELLSFIFEHDNPKFKRDLFERGVGLSTMIAHRRSEQERNHV